MERLFFIKTPVIRLFPENCETFKVKMQRGSTSSRPDIPAPQLAPCLRKCSAYFSSSPLHV